jgi:hypothetical protein
MSFISGSIGLNEERLAVALGFVTLASALATFASCRSCLSFLGRLGLKSPMEMRWYRLFYRYHGYYWWIFLFALVLHILTTVMHTAIPTPGDPDAPIHWVILSFALGSLVMVGVVFFSCRSLVGFVNLFTEKGPLSGARFRSFYRYHSYYWLALILVVAGHFAGAYVHVGIWPG